MARRYVPPAIAPPKGLTGMVEGCQYEPGSVLDLASFPDSMVLLNVYDVSDTDLFTKINKVTTVNNNVLWGGVFHAGVEVFGKEWCYGVTDYGRSGVASVDPRTHPQHTYRCTVPLGATQLTAEQVDALLVRLSQEWPGHEYDLIHHNCISFCNGLLRELLPGGRVPGWVDRAMRTAGFIDLTSKKIKEDTHQTVQMVRTISADLEQRARTLTAAEALEIAEKKRIELAEQASEHIDAIASGEKAQLVRRKTQELGDELGERASAFGASLLAWGQGLQTKAVGSSVWGLADEAKDNLQASVQQAASFVDRGGASDSSASEQASQRRNEGLLDEDDDDLLCSSPSRGGSGAAEAGLIRSAEEKSLKQGLLADDDEDEGMDLIDLASNLQDNSKPQGRAVEAPLVWSSPMVHASETAQATQASGADPIWDLLPADSDANSHVVYGTVEQDAGKGYWAAQGHKEVKQAPPVAKPDPLDGFDLLG